jgi:pimeloyl-ACP methyl ester carboxylesterase
MNLIIVLIAFGVISGLISFLFIDPILPRDAEGVIEEITSKQIPELITGATGYANSKSINIWFETKSNSTNVKGTVLLISGFTSPSTFWHQNFIQSIIDNGYQVIRFDNRSVGLSDWMKNWRGDNPFTMGDMVNDAIAVLDQNNIKKAHVVGYSMGGYIGQTLAIEYPERILSLTSLSSTADFNETGHPKFSWSPLPVIKLFLRSIIIKSDKNNLKLLFKFFEHMNGSNSFPIELILLGERGLYEIHKRKGFNPSARKQQNAAIRNSGPNYDKLDKINIPTLVAHGVNDPVLSIQLAKKYAKQIKNSKQIWLDRTGHVMTNYYIDMIIPDLIKILEKGTEDANGPQHRV